MAPMPPPPRRLPRTLLRLLWVSFLLSLVVYWLAGLLLSGPPHKGQPPADGHDYLHYRGEYRQLRALPYYRHPIHGYVLLVQFVLAMVAVPLSERSLDIRPSRRARRRARRAARLKARP